MSSLSILKKRRKLEYDAGNISEFKQRVQQEHRQPNDGGRLTYERQTRIDESFVTKWSNSAEVEGEHGVALSGNKRVMARMEPSDSSTKVISTKKALFQKLLPPTKNQGADLVRHFVGEQHKREARLARRKSSRFDGLVCDHLSANVAQCVLQREISGGHLRIPAVYGTQMRRFAISRIRPLPITLLQQKRIIVNGEMHCVPRVTGRVNAMEFHSLGDLLATAASDGSVSVFSMRRVLSGSAQRGNQVRAMVSRLRQKKIDAGETPEDFFYDLNKVRSKTQTVWKRIEGNSVLHAIAWDPAKTSKVAVGGRGSPRVSYFDVSRADGKSRQFASTACKSISTLKFNAEGKLLLAGSYDGRIVAWDPRGRNVDQWNAQLLGKSTQSSALGSSTVTGVCCAPDGYHIAASTMNGYMLVYDLRKMHTPTFSSRKQPSLQHQWAFPYKGELAYTQLTPQTRGQKVLNGIVSMHASPDSDRFEVILQQQSGAICVVNPISGSIVEAVQCRRPHHSSERTAWQTRFEDYVVEDATSTVLSGQSARGGCLASLNSKDSRIVCAAFPGIHSVQIFDFGQPGSPTKTPSWNQISNRVQSFNLALDYAPVSIAASPKSNTIAVANETNNSIQIFR